MLTTPKVVPPIYKLEPEIKHHTPESYTDLALSTRKDPHLLYKLEKALQMQTLMTFLLQEAATFISNLQNWSTLLQRSPAFEIDPPAPKSGGAALAIAKLLKSKADRLQAAPPLSTETLTKLTINHQFAQRKHASHLWQLREAMEALHQPQPATLNCNC